MLIVFEGLDGSGKATQTNLLMERLKKEGYEVAKIDFPQYGTKSAGLVEEYLNGKYGASINVGPLYRASIFYACDRYDASFKIKKWINEGKIVVCDRYVSSNAGHQGGKIKDKKERGEFLKWLYNLEYGIFRIPKPDFTFFLKTSPEFSLKLAHKITDEEKKAKRKAYLGDKERDIHEEDRIHLTDALNCYIEIAEEFPREFKIIECLDAGELLPPEAIHERVWKLISEMLKNDFQKI